MLYDYNVGDKVVNSNNLKMGNVKDIDMTQNKVLIQYSDGLCEWVEQDTVKNLLIDENTAGNQFIQD